MPSILRERREVPILSFLIMISIFLAITKSSFTTTYNLYHLSRWTSAVALLCLGEMFILALGGVDLSAGSMISLLNVFTAIFMVEYNAPIILAVIVVVAIGVSIGAVQGLFSVRFSPPLPFIIPSFIFSLGVLNVAHGSATFITKGYPIVPLPAAFRDFAYGYFLFVPKPLLVLIAVVLLLFFLMEYTNFGVHILATGGNPTAALLSGISIKKVRMICFSIAGLLYALSAITITSLANEGNPGIGPAYLIVAIAGPVLGGISLAGGEGSVLGALIGAMVMEVIENGLILYVVSPYHIEIALGIILVAAVTLDLIKRRREATV